MGERCFRKMERGFNFEETQKSFSGVTCRQILCFYFSSISKKKNVLRLAFFVSSLSRSQKYQFHV